MRDRLLLFFLSSFLGLSIFFSFFVAPTLFKVLSPHQAGSVVERIFPLYFGLATVVGLISFIFSGGLGRLYRVLSFVLLLLSAFEFFYMNPVMHELKKSNYSLFLKYHGVSMLINMVIIILSCSLVVLLILRGRGER